MGIRFRERFYVVFGLPSTVVQLAFPLHHEVIISSENDDYGNWSFQDGNLTL